MLRAIVSDLFCCCQPVLLWDDVPRDEAESVPLHASCDDDDCCDCPPTFVFLTGHHVKALPRRFDDGVDEIIAQHCTIPRVSAGQALPPALVRLEISYSNLVAFDLPELQSSLAYVNLSHNRMRAIPGAVYNLFERKMGGVTIDLRGNDFWFTQYSSLPVAIISPSTVGELVRAHRMNIVSTATLRDAVNILRRKDHIKAADSLQSDIEALLKRRVEDGGYTWDNAENAHGTGVKASVEAAVERIMGMETDEIEEVAMSADELAASYVSHGAADGDIQADLARHFREEPSYAALARKVLAVANAHRERDAVLAVLAAEVRDGLCTCRSGRLARLVNALNGFVEGISVGLSRNEELANAILVIRNRNTRVFAGDVDAYTSETVPAVMQALEDACVPVVEQGAWLEYV